MIKTEAEIAELAKKYNMPIESIKFWLQWRPACCSSHKGYRVCCGLPGQQQTLRKSNGTLLLFRKFESAKKRADELNQVELKGENHENR